LKIMHLLTLINFDTELNSADNEHLKIRVRTSMISN
jgi:hypothetical protein